jgi:N-acetylmuramoyl-L-alanine amidase
MYNEHPSTKRIVLTFLAWGVGLLAVIAAVVAISTAIAPPTPSDTAPVVATSTPVPTPTVGALVVPPPVGVPAQSPTSAPSMATTPTPSVAPTVSRTQSLAGKVVAIDAGHQGTGDLSPEPIGPGAKTKKPKVQSGTTGVATRNPEGLINLLVARKLQQELVARGAEVVMVRTSQDVNIANSKRAAIANDAKADLFIRLHCDGNVKRSMLGLSTLVPASNKWTRPIVGKSRRAGRYVHKAVISATGANDLGVTDRGDLTGFNWSKVPTVLVEMGFMSNPGEDVKLGTAGYQQKLAVGLADGIEDYLTSK